MHGQQVGQLNHNFGFTNTGRTCKQESSDRSGSIIKTGFVHNHGIADLIDGWILSEHHLLQVGVKISENVVVIIFKNNRHMQQTGEGLGYMLFIKQYRIGRSIGLGFNLFKGAEHVKYVKCLVRQIAVVHILHGKLDYPLQYVFRIDDIMEFLIRFLGSLENFQSIRF